MAACEQQHRDHAQATHVFHFRPDPSFGEAGNIVHPARSHKSVKK
jgi:hypothetical protein